jgi:2-keto-4-pentenoate hydratase/2-oxohepta-3-ene-1,7-dioic acid hydratase in catechol pathway
MRLVTYCSPASGPPRAGVRVGHRVLDIEAASRVDGEPLPASIRLLLREGRGALARVQALAKAAQSTPGRFSSAMAEEGAIRFMPPVPDPDKLLCVAATQPDIGGFVKLNASLVGHNAKVAKPAAVARLCCEPELVFVIGRRALGVASDLEIEDYVAGVTLLNDLTDGDLHEREAASGSRSWESKNAPGFGPLGPEIVTLDEVGDPYDLWLTCSVNGEERLRMNTREQPWRMEHVLAHFSRAGAVEPGDMFAIGAPASGAACVLKPGDVVECAIEGVTTLRNTIVAG